MAPRRIAYVLNVFPKISETFIAGELLELRRRGLELRVFSLLRPQPGLLQHSMIERSGLLDKTAYAVADFPKLMREFRPELIHAHFAREATEKARELAADLGVPFSFTAHGYDIHRKPPPDFAARAAAAGAVITVSESNATYIHERFGVPRSHMRVIPCGIDLATFCPRDRNVSTSERPVIVCVARHVEVKNLGLLLEACSLLMQRGVSFDCVLIGDGPLHSQLQAQAQRLGLQSAVRMPGAADQEEVLKWWQQADIGVLTSNNEGMPVCLMEAAACGVPVVATRVGGIPELVEHERTGLLAPPGDANSFARALEGLLQNPDARRRMGLAARARAEARFSVAQQVDALLKVWSDMLRPVQV
jgi:colanic acid/amylovoran biosynthesis glycosyltransferase